MALGSAKALVKRYYDQEAEDYINMYKEGYKEYPANLIRLKIILKRLKENKVKSLLDAGCGAALPMIEIMKEGIAAKGFDFSEEMVKRAKAELKKAGYDPNLVWKGDIEDGFGPPEERFGAAMALGVFPHIRNEKKALMNMRKILNKKGIVLIEFRNDLFAAYTLNKYSLDFFLNRVIELNSIPAGLKDKVADFYSERLKADKAAATDSGRIAYTDIPARFHNPLSIEKDLFKPCGFSVTALHFYHYHALPPVFENEDPNLFRKLSIEMEDPSSWKGYLMASAFVCEAKRDD